jgi:hypothetical protein
MADYPAKLSPEVKSRLMERIGAQCSDPSLIKAYQAEFVYQLSQEDATDEEVIAALQFSILDLKGSLAKVRSGKKTSKRGHPFRYRTSSMPKAVRVEGKLIWISDLVIIETPVTLEDVQAYAKLRLREVPDNGAGYDGVFSFLLSEAENLLAKNKSHLQSDHPIHQMEGIDLILFAIDAADLTSQAGAPLKSFFRIQDYFADAISMYYDKINA